MCRYLYLEFFSLVFSKQSFRNWYSGQDIINRGSRWSKMMYEIISDLLLHSICLKYSTYCCTQIKENVSQDLWLQVFFFELLLLVLLEISKKVVGFYFLVHFHRVIWSKIKHTAEDTYKLHSCQHRIFSIPFFVRICWIFMYCTYAYTAESTVKPIKACHSS